jgi:hypothetical protein
VEAIGDGEFGFEDPREYYGAHPTPAGTAVHVAARVADAFL